MHNEELAEESISGHPIDDIRPMSISLYGNRYIKMD